MEPLHITEFASPRYFSKLNQLEQAAGNNAPPTTEAGATTSTTPPAARPPPPVPPLQPVPQPSTFILPLGRSRTLEDELQSPVLKPGEQKKRSLGHDLTALRTRRRPTFTGSFGRLKSKVTVTTKSTSLVEHHQVILAEDPTALPNFTISDLYFSLPNELQAQIIAPLPIRDILNLRLVSKTFHTLVALNESPITRYHIANSIPAYALRLYPLPDPADVNLHYLCSIWHRLHVALKLSTKIAAQATKEIFLRHTVADQLEFAPQHRRMRQNLIRVVFTLFHFFESYRELHTRHLAAGGVPLHLQAFTLNPIECQVMAMYDDRTLLKVHQAFPLVVSSFSRRLRPPSYVGSVERALKGYLKDRPSDEIYATILSVGGLRQAQRFWETKGYNSRRAAVDNWYGIVTRSPVQEPPKSKMSLIANLNRMKVQAAKSAASASVVTTVHDDKACNEWFCIKPSCQAARRRHSTDNLVFHSSLSAGPPMRPLSQEELRLLLPDLPHLSHLWMHTAEAIILERKIVERPQDIKRNHTMLLDLVTDDGMDGIDDWAYSSQSPVRIVNTEGQEGMGPGAVSD